MFLRNAYRWANLTSAWAAEVVIKGLNPEWTLLSPTIFSQRKGAN